jgi:uncharacterized damage-inducible protein DinB
VSSDLLDTWRRNHATNAMLLDAIPDEGLAARYSPRTRVVASQFAHLHNVRVYHLKKRGKAHLGKLTGFARGAEPGRDELLDVLVASTEAVGRMLEQCEQADKVPSWRGPPASFLGYFCAHEAHHRGLVLVSCRLSGVKVDRDVRDGLWNWSRRFEWQDED